MTYGIVQSGTFAATTAISRSVTVTGVTAGSTIVVFTRLQSENRSFGSLPSDDKSNTGWTYPTNGQLVVNGSNTLNAHYCQNCTAGTTVITLSFDSASAISEGCWFEVSGLGSSSFQVAANAQAAAASANIVPTVASQPAVVLLGSYSSTGSRPLSTPTATGVTFTQRQNTANQVAIADGRVTATGALTIAQAVTGGNSGIVGIALVFSESAGGTAYTLTAAQGSYALTGKASGLNKGFTIAAAQGSYSILGSTALVDITMVAAQGSYALTGQAAGLLYKPVLTAAQGSYTVNGQTVTLRYSGAPSTAAYPKWLPLAFAARLSWLRYAGFEAAAISEAQGTAAWARRQVLAWNIEVDVHSVPSHPRTHPSFP